MKIDDVVAVVNGIAPFSGACAWDNCGLMCGDKNDSVSHVLVTLDADMYALKLALKYGCTLVISHHPLVFDPLRAVTADAPIYHFIKNGIAVISAHTCLDAADGGINDLLTELAAICDPQPLFIEGCALGRYGELEDGTEFTNDPIKYIDFLKARIGSKRADFIIKRPIRRAAVVSGSGGSALALLNEYGIDTLITGEGKHEHFVFADNNGLNLIALGHFETENIIVKPFARRLETLLTGVRIFTSDRTELIRRR